ncbi:MAG: GntR family transcriptional regulator [Alphaproteobacteria bacterium]|nr:GntR family transcriptional regulator [Alphaproteobacteria bacterium]
MRAHDSIRRAPPLSEVIAERLIEDISYGQLPLGTVLSENKLAERFGTSKTPVREAFLRLQSVDLVEVLPQRGAVIFQPSQRSVRDLSGFRFLLETGALDSTPNDKLPELGNSLSGIADEMEAVFSLEDPHAYQLLDNRFHVAIVEQGANRFLSEAYARIVAKISALRTHLSSPQKYLLQKSLEEHRMIANKLQKSEISYVRDLLRDHIQRTSEFHQRLIQAQERTAGKNVQK